MACKAIGFSVIIHARRKEGVLNAKKLLNQCWLLQMECIKLFYQQKACYCWFHRNEKFMECMYKYVINNNKMSVLMISRLGKKARCASMQCRNQKICSRGDISKMIMSKADTCKKKGWGSFQLMLYLQEIRKAWANVRWFRTKEKKERFRSTDKFVYKINEKKKKKNGRNQSTHYHKPYKHSQATSVPNWTHPALNFRSKFFPPQVHPQH